MSAERQCLTATSNPVCQSKASLSNMCFLAVSLGKFARDEICIYSNMEQMLREN